MIGCYSLNIKNNLTYAPAPDILFTEVNDELVLYDHSRGLHDGVYILDDIGARIWQLINECGDKAQVVTQLLKEYEVDEMTIEKEVGIFINQLIDKGFLFKQTTRDDL